MYEHPRTLPIREGYHPLFNFVPETKHGGAIHLLEGDQILPGGEARVEIWFPTDEIAGSLFSVGSRFTFDEGTPIPIGEGVIEEILKGERPPFY